MKEHHVALIPTLKLWKYELRHDRASAQDRFAQTGVGQLRAWLAAGGMVMFYSVQRRPFRSGGAEFRFGFFSPAPAGRGAEAKLDSRSLRPLSGGLKAEVAAKLRLDDRT
jgi:hypothetical protein